MKSACLLRVFSNGSLTVLISGLFSACTDSPHVCPLCYILQVESISKGLFSAFVQLFDGLAMVPFAELLCPVHGFMEIVAELGDLQFQEEIIWLGFFLTYALLSVHVRSLMLCCWVRVLGRVRPGIYPNCGWENFRTSMKMKYYRGMIRQWSGGVFFSYWMSMAGVTFHPDAANSELGQMHGLLPDCSVIGSNSFWGMGCYSTMVDTQDGYVSNTLHFIIGL